ncbi:MAG: hypothetical protein Q7S35_13535 [Candidatus Limnocylindrales bacterium]|nr:hypothetical protein [Candidatus Limnocylindrales bacterium]
MKKRTTAAILWLYAGSLLADMFGVNPVMGLIPGIAFAGLIAAAPPRIAWVPRRVRGRLDGRT